MALKNNERVSGKIINVLSDGKMRLSVPEGTEGAEKREYETSDGKKGVKYELVFTELSGLITDVRFWEGNYGQSIQVTVIDGEEEPVILSLSTSSNFGEDLMKKLPNINLDKPVVISPFSFENDKGKKVRGVNITQDGKKIENYYYDPKTKKNIHGYPELTDEFLAKKGKTKWSKYFDEAREFLVGEVTKQFELEESGDDF